MAFMNGPKTKKGQDRNPALVKIQYPMKNQFKTKP